MTLKPLGFTVDGAPIGVPCPECTDNTTPKGSPMTTPAPTSPTALVLTLGHRYDLIPAREPIEGWPYFEAGGRILAHIDTLESDAREAHSAAKALGCTVADLVDRVKEPRPNPDAPTTLGLLQQLHTLIPLARRHGTMPTHCSEAPAVLAWLRILIHDLQEELARAHRERDEAQRGMVALSNQPPEPTSEVRTLMADRNRFEMANADLRQQLLTVLHRVNAALPPEHRGMVPIAPEQAAEVIGNVGSFVAHHGHKMEALRLLAEEVHDARKALGLTDPHTHLAPAIRALQIEARNAAPMATTLQAIAEALPSDLRYDADLAGTVRELVKSLDDAHHRLARPNKDGEANARGMAVLRELLEHSSALCSALAAEVYDADPLLLALLSDFHPYRLAPALLARLTSPYQDQQTPKVEPPSPQAKALEGLCSVAFRRYPLRPGRLEAIGGNLLRFKPESGGELLLNCDRRDLEVYPLDPSDMKATFNDPIAVTPKPPDDDIPW